MINLEKMNMPACPYTVKEFSSKKGLYCLKSNCVNPNNEDASRYFKLYKKENIDGLDSFRLVAQKIETKIFRGMDITKDLFNKDGEVIEKSHICLGMIHNDLDIQGKSFKINKSIDFRSKKCSNIEITMKLDNITPMVKRVLKFISNMK